MRFRPVLLGTAIGLVIAAGIIGLQRVSGTAQKPTKPEGVLLADCQGAIQELVVHYTREGAALVEKCYRDFLSQLPADVTVHVVCPEREDFDDLQERIGSTACSLKPVLVSHALTPWSRDRWLALAPVEGATRMTLYLPREENAAEVWANRAGDQRAGADLAALMPHRIRAWRSPWFFDGGDFVADERTVFATPAVLRRNLHLTVQEAEALRKDLEAQFRRRVVLLKAAPDHHAGMFMMPVGERRMLVGDPRMAQKVLTRSGKDRAPCCPCGDDFSSEAQQLFDQVAEQATREGYLVTRIPVVPGTDTKTYLSYVNVILDERDGQRVVYLPHYTGQKELNREAARIWQSLNYKVRPVDCTTLYPHFGSLRCVVNVLRRG